MSLQLKLLVCCLHVPGLHSCGITAHTETLKTNGSSLYNYWSKVTILPSSCQLPQRKRKYLEISQSGLVCTQPKTERLQQVSINSKTSSKHHWYLWYLVQKENSHPRYCFLGVFFTSFYKWYKSNQCCITRLLSNFSSSSSNLHLNYTYKYSLTISKFKCVALETTN